MSQVYKTLINPSMDTQFKATHYLFIIQWDIIIWQTSLSVNSMVDTVWDWIH